MTLFPDNELIADNFAGGGGASKGIEHALSRSIDLAINHDETAIAMHTVNHPRTKHFCESVWDVDPKEACEGRPVGLAWFSPDCKHFSKARGSKPVDKNIRALAWVVVRWAAKVKPRMIMLENVEEFLDWGPLIKGPDGEYYPDPEKKGKTFNAFVKALQRLGYAVDWKELRACDFGSPTIRKRLFMVARCDEEPIRWPDPTHGDPSSDEVNIGLLEPWHTAAECIQWDISAPSIFERSRGPLAENTQRRIAKGIMRYVLNSADPFIVTYYGPTKPDDFRGQSLYEPLRTLSTANRHALVTPYLMVNTTGHAGSKVTEPVTLASGNHQYLVSSFLAKHYTGVVGSDLKDPLGTITSRDHHSLVVASIIRHFGKSVGSHPDTPIGTITPGGGGKAGIVTTKLTTGASINNHSEEVYAFLLKYYGTDQNPKLREPLHTVTTKDRFALVMVNGIPHQLSDVGMRMLAPRELFRAQGFPDSYIIDRDIEGNRFTKSAQVALCGNSVCPDLAEALVEANISNGQKRSAKSKTDPPGPSGNLEGA